VSLARFLEVCAYMAIGFVLGSVLILGIVVLRSVL
jgi:hypothetical protein